MTQPNPWFELVERLRRREQRFEAQRLLSGGELSARASRGRLLEPACVDALIGGLAHASPVVRRCCLEILDQHPDARATPAIRACLDDPVPRVRWHAVHTLSCDVCKAGSTLRDDDLDRRFAEIARSDTSPKVRAQAALALSLTHSAHA